MAVIHQDAGGFLLSLINEVWESEDTMKAWCKAHVHLDLDRTTRAKLLVTKMVDTALESAGFPGGSITPQDRRLTAESISAFLGVDIFSQIMLNLQDGCPAFDHDKMLKAVANIQAYEPEVSPMAKKAKYRAEVEEGDKQYNLDLALIRNLNIVEGMSRGTNSYRITPFHKTPALADLNNLSSLSLSQIEPYLQGGELYLFDPHAVLAHMQCSEDESGITSPMIRRPIKSESGGDIIKKALASRFISASLLGSPAIKHVVPRYESVLVLREGESVELNHLVADLGLLTIFGGKHV